MRRSQLDAQRAQLRERHPRPVEPREAGAGRRGTPPHARSERHRARHPPPDAPHALDASPHPPRPAARSPAPLRRRARAARAGQVQLWQRGTWMARAEAQQFQPVELAAPRGDIFDERGTPLAQTRQAVRLSIAPREVRARRCASAAALLRARRPAPGGAAGARPLARVGDDPRPLSGAPRAGASWRCAACTRERVLERVYTAARGDAPGRRRRGRRRRAGGWPRARARRGAARRDGRALGERSAHDGARTRAVRDTDARAARGRRRGAHDQPGVAGDRAARARLGGRAQRRDRRRPRRARSRRTARSARWRAGGAIRARPGARRSPSRSSPAPRSSRSSPRRCSAWDARAPTTA